jgi:hypothetical protein
MHVDDVVLGRRAANSRIAVVEVVDRIVAGTDVEHELSSLGPPQS